MIGAWVAIATAFGSSAVEAAIQDKKPVIQALSAIFENSTPVLQYTYVENIGDKRGYTFGFIGFCSGTYDGTEFLKEYQRLNPNNPLVKYIPAFEAIDAGPHDSEGRNPSLAGLDGFPEAFQSCGGDPAFVQAQQNLADGAYWNPARIAARKLGAKRAITLGELYDACINHGRDGMNAMIRETTALVDGSPKTGVSESKWLEKFLTVRLGVLKADDFQASTDRIAVYQKLLRQKNLNLRLPMRIRCYGDVFNLNESDFR